MATLDPNTENLRLLVVDDEKDIVEAYAGFLSPQAAAPARKSSRGSATAAPVVAPAKFEVLKAFSGEEAVALMEAELKAGRRIAGGFFDVKMEGGMDGIQTLQRLFKMDPDLQATIVTAYQDRSVQDIDQIFGAAVKDQWDYLNKPFTMGEIIQKARHMTAAWNRLRALERAQAQLVQSERLAAIGQVARGVGHEFGNILQRIVGKADIALGSQDLKAVKESLEVIMQAAENASVIVQNLQSFSKRETPTAPLDIAKVLTGALTLVHHDLVTRTITLDNKLAAVPPIQGRTVEIGQVFVNLLINAMDAIGKNGTIEAGTKVEGNEVVAWVKDTGPGIAPDVLPRVFDYAFTTKGDKGSGLGLAISKKIIESHGGTITVVSSPGKGALFTVRLPHG